MSKARQLMLLPILLAICLIFGIFSKLYNFNTYLDGAVILLLSGSIMLTWYLLAPFINRLTRPQIKGIIVLVLGLMLLLQILILIYLPDTIFHDPYRVLSQADKMAAGKVSWKTTYFWRYPNNVPITYLLALWLRLTLWLGLSTNVALDMMNVVLLDIFICLVLYTLYQCRQKNTILLGTLAFLTMTPFAYTYYLQVFYSDLPAMLSLLVIFRTLIFWPRRSKQQRFGSGVLLCAAVLLGQLLKPNLIVLLPALAILLGLIFGKKIGHHFKLWTPVLLIVLGFALSLPAKQLIYTASNFQPHAAYELPVTSWILTGTNAASKGTYASADVQHAVKLPNKQARQQYDLKAIATRVQRLGPKGLLKLWAVKLGVFFDVSAIQDWYNGGFRAAPAWYQNHAQFLSTLTAITYQVATIVLLLTASWRLIIWRPNLKHTADVVALLAVLTTLGYLAFHVIFWEVEARYGQLILPLLIFQIAALPKPRPNHNFNPHLLPLLLVLVTGIGLMGWSKWLADNYPRTQVVAAQRSQLSAQYHALPTLLAAGSTITQQVAINASATYFSVQIHQNVKVLVRLTNLKTHQTYNLKRQNDVYRLTQALNTGKYRITVTNNCNTGQQIDIINTYHYQLANYPLMIHNQKHFTSSLVYTALAQQNAVPF
ncbi:MAG: hypothetical protein LKF36_13145 [Lactobacillus sp.]|nr:hypothetical protein [Lactobacillus sp.]